MTKTPLAIGAIGVAGCVLLSLIMKQLVAEQSRAEAPVRRSLEAGFREQIVGRLAVHEEQDGDRVMLVVQGQARADVDRRALADRMVQAAWQLLPARTAIAQVQVRLRDAVGQQPVAAWSARPRAR